MRRKVITGSTIVLACLVSFIVGFVIGQKNAPPDQDVALKDTAALANVKLIALHALDGRVDPERVRLSMVHSLSVYESSITQLLNANPASPYASYASRTLTAIKDYTKD